MCGNERERRRRGPVNTARRAIYGLALLLCNAYTVANARGLSSPSRPQIITVSVRPVAALIVGSTESYRIKTAVDDPRLTPRVNRLVRVFRFRSTLEKLSDLRNGIGLDIALPDAGALHLNLHPNRKDLHTGKHWSWHIPGISQEPEAAGVWWVGATLDMVETKSAADPGRHRRRLVLSPELVIDAHRALYLPGKAQMILQYANWRGEQGGASSADQVWQIHLNWRF